MYIYYYNISIQNNFHKKNNFGNGNQYKNNGMNNIINSYTQLNKYASKRRKVLFVIIPIML